MKNIISAFLIAVGLGIAGHSIGDAIIKNKTYGRYVSVKGLSEKTVKSDKAVWSIQFNYADDDLANLYGGISHAQNKIKDFLLKQGFSASDIQMSSVSVSDNEANNYGSNQKLKRYSASAGVILSTNQIDNVNNALQKTGELIQNGIVITNSYIRYFFTQLNSIKPVMLDQATANAKDAAEIFARNSGSKLGIIRSASQGLFSISDANDNSSGGEAEIMKKVRIVTSVDYLLE